MSCKTTETIRYTSYTNWCDDPSFSSTDECTSTCSIEQILKDGYSRISIDLDLPNDQGKFTGSSLSYIRVNGKINFQENMFENCKSLETIEFTSNSGITEIPAAAFKDCTSLSQITLYDKSIPVGVSAFENCESLTEYIFEKKVSSEVTIPENAFKGCTSLTSVTIPHEEITIGNSAFEDCTSLTSFKEDRSYSKLVIGEAAFRHSGLKSIYLRVTQMAFRVLEEIPQYAFYNCPNLEQVRFDGN